MLQRFRLGFGCLKLFFFLQRVLFLFFASFFLAKFKLIKFTLEGQLSKRSRGDLRWAFKKTRMGFSL